MIMAGKDKLIIILIKENEIHKTQNNAKVLKKCDNKKFENYELIMYEYEYKQLNLSKKLDQYIFNKQEFRKGYTTANYLLTMKLLIKKCTEYNVT